MTPQRHDRCKYCGRELHAWLAWQMTQHHQTLLSLERLQPTWLPDRVRWIPRKGGMLSSGLVGELVVGLIIGLSHGLDFGLVSGSIFGLLYGTLLGLAQGASGRRVFSQEIISVETLHWSWAAVRSGFIRNLGPALGGGLVGRLAGGPASGGDACLQHLTLRLILVRHSFAPWRYVAFLDYADERILLRKVGGGYIFIHRLLQDYFASLYEKSGEGAHPETIG
jgi:hypothetical protein